MRTLTKTSASKSVLGGMALVAALGLGAASTAQAGDNVFWSVGVSSPGVQLGFGSAGYVAPPPVYVAPRPVVVAPAPVYYRAPLVAYNYPGWGRERFHEREGFRGYEFRGREFRGGERFERGFEGRGDGHRR